MELFLDVPELAADGVDDRAAFGGLAIFPKAEVVVDRDHDS